ncbi:nicotinate-nucleotide-dimethylbenzimidazole phosphoribosyltransferase [Cnuella takakiae]|uniref:Nicotinate-nucleotide--dimethylbenzimidazole phosphoribosyltransferase n=1 Tax=Cnuella takakiae TaxID=1302690 RepID=A0A1M5E318_9BACT|nr:nicotinate-nucleotide--dimethylbenzimidazole phosphoribosyltransferase [Cnuella takakiae]OLY93792.1 nicotinate-nucleotide--dimethylbenzimidazole phosphoribosyltransferase [Cnuella takakiae]SHF73658.1 nicotinate-nucleotide-dimethylbenzimidazole phosphoribosyltransferase [Cnuella takakiae]
MLRQELQQIIDQKTKPLGALGQLEAIALQVGLVQNTSKPTISKPHIVVFAADHGIATTGLVNPYPQAVTAQMVLNFLGGGAAINVFCRQHHIGLSIVDAGVACQWEEPLLQDTRLLQHKIAAGTANYLEGPAMTAEQCATALHKGREVVQQLSAAGCNTIGFGEMGIGNTSSAALIMSSLLQLPVSECVGRGTGADDAQLRTKISTLETVSRLHQIEALHQKPLELLQVIGGFEIAMMTGAYLEACAQGLVMVVDGFITTAALLLARAIVPAVVNNCIFAHCSGEQGHQKMLEALGAKPLLHLDMRLGEGTGAALAIPLVQSAVLFVHEMASFASAGVSEKQ